MILRGKGEAKVSFNLVYYIDESNFTPEEKEAFDRLKSNPESPEYIKLENILYNKYAVELVKRQVDTIGCELIEVYKREFEEHPIEDSEGRINAMTFITQQLLVAEYGEKIKNNEDIFCHICGQKIINHNILNFNDLKIICDDCSCIIRKSKNK